MWTMPVKNDKKSLLYLLLIIALSLSHINIAYAYDTVTSVFIFQKKMAEKGNVESQYKLAMMYEVGSGVEKNLQAARIWYGRASYQNYKPAFNRLTYLDIKQNGFKDHHKPWLNELRREAELNDGESLLLLGQMYSEGIGVQKSLTRSISLLKQASAGNVSGAESEILRVEKELHELQVKIKKREIEQKYQLEKQKKLEEENIRKQIEINQVKKQKQREAQKALLEKRQTLKKKRQLEAQKKRAEAEKLKQEEIKKKLKLIQQQNESQNPTNMDSNSDAVCSGRNRFSPTCR